MKGREGGSLGEAGEPLLLQHFKSVSQCFLIELKLRPKLADFPSHFPTRVCVCQMEGLGVGTAPSLWPSGVHLRALTSTWSHASHAFVRLSEERLPACAGRPGMH